MQKLQLLDVTVCAADSVHPGLAARALQLCLAQCDFADAILFSDTPARGAFRNVTIAPMNSIEDYSQFCLRTLPELVTTPFVLVMQWDGYVLDAGAWANAFRKYDYVGGLWSGSKPGHRVGNGGFSLRSRKLLKAALQLPPVPHITEDMVICRVFRRKLEDEFGIRFAPEKLAERFSYEDRYPGHPTFGFHGLPNLWRHTTEAELLAIVDEFPRQQLASWQYLGLVYNCLRNDRLALAGTLYARVRHDRAPDLIEALMAKILTAPVARQTVEKLETLYAGA